MTHSAWWVVLALLSSSACSPIYSKRGAGATTDDRPVFQRSKTRMVWGLVGQPPSADVAKVCANGDALIETHRSALNYTIVGLLRFRTKIVVYCRDDEYRTQRIEERRQRREYEAALEENRRQQLLAVQSAPPTAVSETPSPVAVPSDPPDPDDAAPSSQSESPQPSAQPSESAPAGSEEHPQISRQRTVISNAKSTARTHEECDAQIPRVEDKDPLVSNALTDSKRRPCHDCIDREKTFSIYGLQPLRSSCD